MAKPKQWRRDLDEFNRADDHQKLIRNLTADLPINSSISISIADDPYPTGTKIPVVRSIRDDTLAGMHARRQIDDAQLAAGRLWQKFYERGEVGSITAIDPTREAVDGGRIPEPITDRQISALRKLDESHQWLGREGYSIVYSILGERTRLKDAALMYGYLSQREIEFFGQRFRNCLEELAVLWGFAQRTVSNSPPKLTRGAKQA